MKKCLIIILTYCIFFKCEDAFAQAGCKINSGNLVYTQPANGAINGLLGALLGPGYGPGSGGALNQFGPCVSLQQYYYRPRIGSSCRVCTGGFTNPLGILACNDVLLNTGEAGTLVDMVVIPCDLDDYSWALGASAGVLGIFVIRKRKKI